MAPDEDAAIIRYLRETTDRSRGYAEFFSWVTDRDLEEWGVAATLAESLAVDDRGFFHSLKSRGRGRDPPDCEAVTKDGERIAIEVTELVDGRAIRLTKAKGVPVWSVWTRSHLLTELQQRLNVKDQRFQALKDPPYPGGYIVVVHTDEPMLSSGVVADFLEGHIFARPAHIEKAYLQLSYEPVSESCPYFELNYGG